MKEKDACLRGDRHLDLFGELEPSASFERLLRQEDPHEPLELLAIGVVELAQIGHVLLQDGALGRGERLFAKLGAAAVLEEIEDGRHGSGEKG